MFLAFATFLLFDGGRMSLYPKESTTVFIAFVVKKNRHWEIPNWKSPISIAQKVGNQEYYVNRQQCHVINPIMSIVMSIGNQKPTSYMTIVF